MKKTQNEADKALDTFFEEFIAKQKAQGASVRELEAEGNALIKGLMKRFYESALQGEMTDHLGYAKGESKLSEESNLRNGKSRKKLITGHGELDIEVPRDREGQFEPQLVVKHQRRLPGFDEKVLYLYGQGTSQRDIQSQLEEIYGIEVSQELISSVTDTVLEESVTGRSMSLWE